MSLLYIYLIFDEMFLAYNFGIISFDKKWKFGLWL